MELNKILLAKYKLTRDVTVNLCKPLIKEDYVVQPIEDVSPPKWHLGHTSWFFEVFILIPYAKNYSPFHKDFNFLFNSYYESLGDRVIRASRGNLSRPSVDEIYNYRKSVDTAIIDFIENNKLTDKKIIDFILLGINHEQQHQELLLTDIKYILGTNPLFPAYISNKKILENKNPYSAINDYHEIPAGNYQIGHLSNEFCFDNEKAAHIVLLNDFYIRKQLVSNKEFLDFIDDGGYKQFQFWLSEGWNWVQNQNVSNPLYWNKINGNWYEYTLQGHKKLNISLPVTHISFFEADAFARWAGKRLPTEFEWEVAAMIINPEITTEFNFIDSGFFHPIMETNQSHFLGNVWEWTNSAYLPYPGYIQDQGALGEYNGKFMINQMVLKGGSCATSMNHIRHTYRNFFQADKRWQFTGIRLAASK
ncbi:ergothioneine biosynthesis protein EgtB [candidate division KSB1 bacterium]